MATTAKRGRIKETCAACIRADREYRLANRRPPPSKGHSKGYRWILANVNHTGDDCLIWPYSKTRGYGHYGLNGKMLYAHRTMCELVHGKAPKDKPQCRHSCGKGHMGCTNPHHLSWSSQSENHLDRRKHGTAKTSRYGYAGRVLTQGQIEQIKAMRGKRTTTALAEEYEVSRRTIERAYTAALATTGRF